MFIEHELLQGNFGGGTSTKILCYQFQKTAVAHVMSGSISCQINVLVQLHNFAEFMATDIL